MYRAEDFKSFFKNVVGATPATVNTYNSFLKRIDQAIGGLDESIASKGSEAVIAWGATAVDAPFDVYRNHARAVLKRYVGFVTDSGPEQIIEVEEPLEEFAGSFFKLEREMQAAVRSQLEQLESGLKAEDGGTEVTTATGRPDIVGRDAEGKLTVIELKAGLCPAGAMEQLLGYAQSLADERGEEVRAVLIASEFSDRIRAAAKRVPDLMLYRYRFAMHFEVS